MKKVLLIPDSFKGTLSARQVCQIVSEELLRLCPGMEVVSLPVADGGEGTVDALLTALGGRRVTVSCRGPYGEEMEGCYGLLRDGTAIIEMASVAGLPLVGERKDPSQTTTYGVGQLLSHAAHHGATALILGLGGSATNDGGCGCAAALGVRFLDAEGNAFVPVGGTLRHIAAIDMAGFDAAVAALPLTVMCDIDNPLCGPLGAAAVFAPQKGADSAMVQRLDDGLRHLAQIIDRDVGMDVLRLPGGGAAGGFGAGAASILGGTLRSGIDAVLDASKFESHLPDTDLIITGEGKLDSQSLRGKAVIGVARRARKMGVPVVALVGAAEGDLTAVYSEGVSAVFPIHPAPMPFDVAAPRSAEHLRAAAGNVFRLLLAMNPQ